MQMRYDSARHTNMVTSCPAATGPYWVGRRCPSHRCISGGGGRARAGPGRARTCGQAHAAHCQVAGTAPALVRPGPTRGSHRCHPGWCLGAVWVPVPPWLSFGDPCPEPGEPGCWQAPCPETPSSCHPCGLLHWSIQRKATSPALSPPAQPTLCKSKLIRLHSYRHRNTGCVLSLSINAFYHPIKLIKKQSSSSHRVPHPNIINLIFRLMIVSTGGGHGSWSVFVVYN